MKIAALSSHVLNWFFEPFRFNPNHVRDAVLMAGKETVNVLSVPPPGANDEAMMCFPCYSVHDVYGDTYVECLLAFGIERGRYRRALGR